MRLLEQFQRLYDWLPRQPQPSLPEIAAALCCGERNARLLLRRMQEEGWLSWTPGRGRGHRSQLSLLQQPDSLRLHRLRRLLDEGRLEAAFDGLPSQGRERLRQALPAYLGASRGGGLRIPFYRPLHALDPIQVNRRTEAHIIGQLCAGLTEYDREREAVVPALAHHWECQADGREWRFWLRPGLRFHDGRPVSGHDAARSLLRLRDTAGPHQALFTHLADIQADSRQVLLRLDRPDQLLLHRLAHYAAAVLPADDWLRPDFASLPIGAGPFRLVRNNDYRASFAAFDAYYRERPLLDEIDIWVVHPDSPLPEVDISLSYRHLPPDHWTRLQQLEHGCDFILPNPARFADPATRLALGAWLRDAVAKLAESESRPLATGYLPHWRHIPDAAARVPTGGETLTLVTYELDSHIALSNCVANRFREAGTRVDVRVLPYPEFATRSWLDWADLVVAGEVVDDDLAFGLYGSLAGGSLFHAWRNQAEQQWLAEIDRAIAADPDPARRAHLTECGFAHVVAQGWILPMRHTQQGVQHSPHLGGVQLARCGWMDFRKLWLMEPGG
ncbi:SgrR family transcriptional regulator [Chitinimonas arctica]|uniref:SgrR family transcriptional regulator n=1 Tax=Chitinimonas arctica TaxID=2594795 RepID=A0A516SI50_9NEIS|nr:SgrR family transcriptional regulator [Chitinimonas arctica]QDQ27839.1 SgrR family transcriptional regulator [Chitinimonas arctica]